MVLVNENNSLTRSVSGTTMNNGMVTGIPTGTIGTTIPTARGGKNQDTLKSLQNSNLQFESRRATTSQLQHQPNTHRPPR